MDDFDRRLRNFRIALMLRALSYAALCGLLLALVLVIASPWLRQWMGEHWFWITLGAPVLLPALWAALAWMRKPDQRTTVLAADAWSGAKGEVVSAFELRRRDPDSPFAAPVTAKALESLKSRRLPEPPLMRKLLVAMLVLLALVPLSRVVHAELQQDKEEEKQREQAAKTDVDPELAAKLAREAGNAAERAKELGARPQERLADDIEQLARNAQAGGQDKERALREANSLVDRARAQRDAQEGRERARQALKDNPASKRLAEAMENSDARQTQQAINELVESARNPDGSIDPKAAAEIREAIKEAAAGAPHDPALRRAAEKAAEALKDRQGAEQRAREQMQGSGASPEEIEAAIEAMRKVDAETLKKALEELANAASPLRDIDPQTAQELLKRLQQGQIDPEQARRLAEAARELAQRMELDAETLREMLRQGRDFEGLEEAARNALERAQQEGRTPGEEGVPDWAKGAIPEELRKQWEEARGRRGPGRDGEGGEGRKGEGGGEDSRNGGTGKPREIEGGGTEAGVDTKDTGRGEKDPDGEMTELDPEKAREEKARRDASGREATSRGVDTRNDTDHLPRRYREAARKYFER
ncbi:MAG: hypothetical protein KF696_12065 [Planctomycetes bacterium]|nr:hypothetical protein [Planctomycetota bacterium]MCW8136536.1 hypothetical protein [Planctomycetota bacterium]